MIKIKKKEWLRFILKGTLSMLINSPQDFFFFLHDNTTELEQGNTINIINKRKDKLTKHMRF